jgi:hypothetical protein
MTSGSRDAARRPAAGCARRSRRRTSRASPAGGPSACPVTAPWLQPLGATAIPTDPHEMYSSPKTGPQTGVAEGVIMIGTGACPPRPHEVAPPVARIDTGPLPFGSLDTGKPVSEGLPRHVREVLGALGQACSARGSDS